MDERTRAAVSAAAAEVPRAIGSIVGGALLLAVLGLVLMQAGRTDGLQRDVAKLAVDVGTLTATVGTLARTVESVQGDVAVVRRDVDALTDTVAALTDAVGGVQGNVAALTDAVSGLQPPDARWETWLGTSAPPASVDWAALASVDWAALASVDWAALPRREEGMAGPGR